MKLYVRQIDPKIIGNGDEKIARVLISACEADDFDDDGTICNQHQEKLDRLMLSYAPGKNFNDQNLPPVNPMTLDAKTREELVASGHYKIQLSSRAYDHPSVIIPLIDENTGEKQSSIMLIFDPETVETIFAVREWLREDVKETADRS